MATLSNRPAPSSRPGGGNTERSAPTQQRQVSSSAINAGHDCAASGCGEALHGNVALPPVEKASRKPVRYRDRDFIDPALWQREEMRKALGLRDVALVFRLLQRHGVAQRVIAFRTGQSQSEVSEIIRGHRRLVSYDVLVRIAEGLDIPRGWLGLAYDDVTAGLIDRGLLDDRWAATKQTSASTWQHD